MFTFPPCECVMREWCEWWNGIIHKCKGCCSFELNSPELYFIFTRMYLGQHFMEKSGHQRNFVVKRCLLRISKQINAFGCQRKIFKNLNRTFNLPYQGKRRPHIAAILGMVKQQIGGSGFRLISGDMNKCLRMHLYPNKHFTVSAAYVSPRHFQKIGNVIHMNVVDNLHNKSFPQMGMRQMPT